MKNFQNNFHSIKWLLEVNHNKDVVQKEDETSERNKERASDRNDWSSACWQNGEQGKAYLCCT